MRKVLEINVHITGFTQVKGETQVINFISFDGDCHSDIFEGSIIEGGVDTQKYIEGKEGTLSARYILEGKDECGNSAKLFIENNGVCHADGSIETVPYVVSDSPALRKAFEGKLSGKVVPVETPAHDRIIIEIYAED